MTDKTSRTVGDRNAMMEMMPKMMQGMMAQCGEGNPDMMAKVQGMMAKMKQGGPEAHETHMPEMMLKMMMPHCIGMMLPKIAPDKRGEAATAVLSAIVAKGTDGMSDEQMRAFLKALEETLNPST
jgi:hypothetical protein